MRHVGNFEGEWLSRCHGYLEPMEPGEGPLAVCSALALTAFMFAAILWIGVLS